ncbi:MAG TPA: chromosome segregation protein SMC [Verrucomicrobiae bacterium]|nr:chromosome segregation protein SMC [Verrucomicrobiae bacterium]
MYLKNLTVLGFKSFADKTSLNFQRGITAIVGPNGCGKSNVADAVRWVLGEQSAKALRGGEMADVIFNGTDGRKPLGLAEVSLTIGDVDAEHLQAAGVELAYNEVTITRRVFRDGGSEYFINRTPCRLKDIQQLFMGTGVGRTSYSIMAQGNITQILSSKPEDRRMVFEEAAGITKFKGQKREALRKLEYTEQNLLRAGDLIREVKRQIGSLQRQAGKARRYKQLMLELQHLDTQLARHQFDVLQAEIAERQASVDRLRAEAEDCSENVLRGENEIARLRSRFTELEHEISETQHRGLELKSQADRHESRIHFNEERLLEIQKQHVTALNDISEAEGRGLAAKQELAAVSERLAASLLALEQNRRALRTKQEALRGVEDHLARQQEELRQAQSAVFAAAQQLTRVRNEINALDLQKQGNIVRLEKLSAEKIQLEEERARLEQRLNEFAANVETEKLNAQTQRGTVEERHQRLRDIGHQLDQTGKELDGLLQRQAEQRSRLNVLEQLQAEHEGFSAGALAALKQTEHVLGSLADKIWVPDQYLAAVETALGHHLQLVITQEPETAVQILSDLSASKKGRASIAPLAFQKAQTGVIGPVAEGPGEPALKVIVADPAIQELLRALIGRTLIVPDLATATAAWRETEGRFDFVTLGGELLSRQGVYTGGSSNGNGSGKAPSSILGRKNQIAELQAQLGEVQQKVADASRGKGALLSEQTALQAGLQQAQIELRAREVAIATREGESNALQNSQRVLHQKIDTVVYEIQSLAAQEEEGLQKRAALSRQAGGLEDQERELQERLTDLSNGLDSLRQQRDSANTSLTETRVALATQEQLADSFNKQKEPLERRIQELERLVEQRHGEISSFVSRKAQAETEMEESRLAMGRFQHEREQVNAQAGELIGQRDALEGDIGGREDHLREQRQHLAGLQQQRGALDVELAQKNMSVQNLRERIQQKYQVNLDSVRSECITITIADEGPAEVRTLTPEEMTAGGVSTDWNAVAEQVMALQKRIDEMGPVNLVAIDEYEETEQRFQFLTKQNDDLVQAKQQLLEVINRINTQTKEMFTETFNQIRDNFRAMFTEVFGGGKADLILVNEGDVLESGIDIVARPPGKQLQTISLLSGGEQTMTAVALLFAIYQVKPSPFCVLDELDAPLDESNINRFIRILQRFLVHSQFVIITHNKRTIGMADVLYGVTMEEQGVSKIVSVKFHKALEKVTHHTPAPLVPPSSGPPVEDEEDEPHTREETLEVAMAK